MTTTQADLAPLLGGFAIVYRVTRPHNDVTHVVPVLRFISDVLGVTHVVAMYIDCLALPAETDVPTC